MRSAARLKCRGYQRVHALLRQFGEQVGPVYGSPGETLTEIGVRQSDDGRIPVDFGNQLVDPVEMERIAANDRNARRRCRNDKAPGIDTAREAGIGISRIVRRKAQRVTAPGTLREGGDHAPA